MAAYPKPKLHINLVQETKSKLRTGKASGGCDDVVAEMLKAMGPQATYLVACVFAKRVEEPWSKPDIETRSKFVIRFIPKSKDAASMSQMRGISLVNCLLKWYLRLPCEKFWLLWEKRLQTGPHFCDT